jgi:type I restriction enzyme S subunit
MSNNNKTPAIRFKGFTDTWEQRELGEIATEIIAGSDVDKSLLCEEGNCPVIANALTNDGIIGYYKNEYRVKAPAVTVTGRGDVGHAKARNDDFTPVVRLLSIKSEHDIYFLENAINAIKIVVESTGVPQLTVPQLSKNVIFYPNSAEEEMKIGTYFRNLDSLITLHQRKCDKLIQFKAAMLQKMFPQNGADKPEIRFKGFTDAWEQRKVGELCSISTGKSNTQDKIDDGIYPFYVRSPIIEKSNKYLYDEEAVITVGDGVGTGKVFHYVNGKYDLHQRCYRMYGFSDELDAKYFYHTFSLLFYKRVMAMTAKTSVDSVRLEMISDMEIPTPSIDEQLKIGQLFTNIDSIITLHQRKCDKYKSIKAGLIRKLFP